VGTPNPQIEAGLRDEHTKRHLDSDRIFVASNYKIQTMALVEWWFVADPLAIDGIVRKESGPGAEKTCDAEAMARLRMTEDERQRLHDSLRLLNGDKGTKTGSGKFVSWPREDRASLKASSKDAQPRAPSAPLSYLKKGVGVVCAKNRELRSLKSEELHVSELVAARLYTGPMFAKYNAVLRGLRLEFARGTFLELCGADGTYDKWERGELTFREAAGRECNLYPTTLLAINSAILKLSKLTPAQLVYRGVGDRTLPREFTTPNQYNVRGGVECAFMSATPDKNVALGYAQGRNTKTGIIFEMQQGMVDRGADISFLSQATPHAPPHPHPRLPSCPRLPAHRIPSHRSPVPSRLHPVPSRPIPSHPSHPVPPRPTPSHAIPPRRIAPEPSSRRALAVPSREGDPLRPPHRRRGPRRDRSTCAAPHLLGRQGPPSSQGAAAHQPRLRDHRAHRLSCIAPGPETR
jgi:hypothetical protein